MASSIHMSDPRVLALRGQHHTPNALAFAAYYLGPAEGNATVAALMAGYAENSATQTANRLLRNPKVRAELERLRVNLPTTDGVSTQDDRALFLSQIMRDPTLSSAVRLRACDQLSRMQGDYVHAKSSGDVEAEVIFLAPPGQTPEKRQPKREVQSGPIPFPVFDDPEWEG